jgi:hypothetical protein
MPTKEIAKALHTLTTVPNVAKYVAANGTYKNAAELTRATLLIINPGYDYTVAELARIHKAREPEFLARCMDAVAAYLSK